MSEYKSYQTSVIPSIECSLIQSGWQKCEPSYYFGPFIRDYYLIHYILSGKGKLTKNGKNYPVTERQCFLICPGELTFYQADEKEPWEYMWIGFRGSNCQKYLSLCGLSENNPVFSYNLNNNKPDLIEKYIDEINNLEKNNTQYNYAAIGYLYLIFSEMIASSQTYSKKSDNSASLMLKALEYIENNYSGQFTIKELANSLFIDRTTLYRIFNKHLNQNPSEYLTQYRLTKACDFLKNTNFKITLIVQISGFNDIAHFGRLFKQTYGLTPTKYRKTV